MAFQQSSSFKFTRLHFIGVILTVFGISLFAYFVSQAGLEEIWNGIKRLGYGFFIILGLHTLKLSSRALAWTLCVEKPYQLRFFSALKAVIIAEALNTMIPLGILISGTSKALAVRKQLPLVVSLSSVAVENLFYSFATSLLIISGSIAFLFTFHPGGNVATAGYVLIGASISVIVLCFLMVIQEWRLASALSEWLYGRGLAKRVLHHGRAEILRFENLIYRFYRHQPRKFLPVTLLNIAFHAFGVCEVWFILQAISDAPISFLTAFLLETLNRVILIVFKLIPFVLGIDEAGASFITENLGIGNGIGVAMTIIRKGRALFWATVGSILIARSGLSLKNLFEESQSKNTEENLSVSA